MVILPLQLSAAAANVRGKRLIGPIDLTLDAGGITTVIGPNGAGKTTLLRLMHGLQFCSKGTRSWAVPEAEARQKQAFVFQSPIMMRRRVIDSIAYPLRLRGMSKAAANAEASKLATRFGLAEMANAWAPQLSGGEKQKLALARALIIKPEILFLDEPTANLDGSATRAIELILQQAHANGTRIVMSTHDMGQARRLAQDVIFMLGGKIHELAPAPVFFTHPVSREARAFIKGDIVE